MVFVVALVAFAVDVGYMMLTRTQLQGAADAAAMASAAEMNAPFSQVVAKAQEYAAYHGAAGQNIAVAPADVQLGVWDSTTRSFSATPARGNAVKVTTRKVNASLFFGSALGRQSFTSQASAVAMANPRDIVFVVDLSGSMNDDTEPAWATQTIDSTFGPQGYGTVGDDLMQDLYDDFGYGSYPGTLQYIGAPLGVTADKYAYAEMTKNGGPLSRWSIPSTYRITIADSEAVRKIKAYSWMIDKQIAVIMPGVKPPANSSTNYSYWEKYLDYLLLSVTINPPPPPSPPGSGGGSGFGGGSTGGGGGGSSSPPAPSPPPVGRLDSQNHRDLYSVWRTAHPEVSSREIISGDPENEIALGPGISWQAVLLPQTALGATAAPGTPPTTRGTIPPNQDGDRINGFNNPNRQTFPAASGSLAANYRNYIGYRTYVQFMMDFGRDIQPDGRNYVPLSTLSPYCPMHSESTAGGTFSFPPREQPAHSARRALIAAIQVVKDRNAAIPNQAQRDWVSVVTYDRDDTGGPVVLQSLTGDYDAAMRAVAGIQAAGDIGATTATEAGLITAKAHLQPSTSGGHGRPQTNKVVVLLTDGVPNLYETPASQIDSFANSHSSGDFYGGGYYWLDAPIMQCMQMQSSKWQVFPVGLGLGTDYSFMDRMARSGGTANNQGQSPRGSGNPAQYEQRMTDIFTDIITAPRVHLVQ